MEITLFGTGDAVGTPQVGCQCAQCSYAKSHGIERLRTSLLITNQGKNLLIDTTPDLRRQLLQNGSPHIDAVIWTHGHYDHFMGFGEFYRVQKIPPVYAAPEVLEYCSIVYGFLLKSTNPVRPYTSFNLFGLDITLIEVTHASVYTCGVVISDGKTRIAYTSDTNEKIPDKSLNLIRGSDLLFIDGLFPDSFKKVEKHLNYEEAINLAGNLSVRDFRIVHMSHYIPFNALGQGRDGEKFLF